MDPGEGINPIRPVLRGDSYINKRVDELVEMPARPKLPGIIPRKSCHPCLPCAIGEVGKERWSTLRGKVWRKVEEVGGKLLLVGVRRGCLRDAEAVHC